CVCVYVCVGVCVCVCVSVCACVSACQRVSESDTSGSWVSHPCIISETAGRYQLPAHCHHSIALEREGGRERVEESKRHTEGEREMRVRQRDRERERERERERKEREREKITFIE